MNVPEDFLRDVEFIQAISVDINGLARGKLFPFSKLNALLEGKEEMVGMIELFGCRSEIPQSITELSGFPNKHIIPDISTLRLAPWGKDNSLAMVFCDTYDIETNLPWPFNPRLLAKLKLKELEETGYRLLVGVENEFRLFNKDTLDPLTKTIDIFCHFTAITEILPFLRKLNKEMSKLDIEIDSMNMEYGKGQVEIPLQPYEGLAGVDKIWYFRELTKYVGNDMGMVSSYMCKPLAGDSSNGFHINHSLLRNSDLMNAMYSEVKDGKLSEVAQNWLAGLIKHSRGLSAIMCPTVNCFRRIRQGGFAPQNISWNYFTRDVTYRVKTNAFHQSGNFIENRIPSSSCNIYIAIAGMIVAGMDGIKNNLQLPQPGNAENSEKLPTTLEEALEALNKDQILKEGLGEKFVDWYIKAKLDGDVNVLKNVDLDDDTVEGLKEEFYKYLKL